MSMVWEEFSRTRRRTRKRKPAPDFFSSNPAIDRKVKAVITGLDATIQRLFLELPTDEDREVVANFVLACMHQENIAIKTKRVYIISLIYLSRYFDHKKSFKELTDKDLVDYLGSFHRDPIADPDQKWINSRNTNALAISKFFRWVAYPDLSAQERRKLSDKKLPPVLRGLNFVTKRGSKSSIKAKEIWYDQDNAIFLKYCADPRLRFYHALAMDTSGRPHELLQLKIGDIDIKKAPDGRQYVPLDIGRYGKKKKSRIVGMTNSIKYYRAWLQHHPDAGNPHAYVFVSREFSAKYRNVPLSVDSVRMDYTNFRDKYIPALLKKPDIDPEDKIILQQLKEQKRWNPYIIRHSSISKYARNPNINEYTLRQHAGWTKTSTMIDVYTHELGGEHFEDVMLACGIDLRDKKQQEQLQQQLQGKKCPYCSIENVQEAKFCISCKFTLEQESSHEVIEDVERSKREAEESKKRLEELEAKQEILQANNASLFLALLNRDDFGVKTPATIITWNANEGSEGLFKAAALAREENQKREKEHQQKHHDLNQRYQQHRQQQLQQEKEIEDSKLNSKL